jgi:hypothetical protein
MGIWADYISFLKDSYTEYGEANTDFITAGAMILGLNDDHPLESLLQGQRDQYQAILDAGAVPSDIPPEGAYIGNPRSQFRLFVAGDMAGQPLTISQREAIEGVITELDAELSMGFWDIATDEIKNDSLDFVKGIIPALIEGAQAGYVAIRNGFRGKEPETIAAATIAILVLVVGFTLIHEVKTGPGGAGEYAANNRFE